MTTARSRTARDDAPSSARARPRGGSATEAECGPRGGLVVILARVFGFIWDVCGVFMWCICICSNASICQIRISCSWYLTPRAALVRPGVDGSACVAVGERKRAAEKLPSRAADGADKRQRCLISSTPRAFHQTPSLRHIPHVHPRCATPRTPHCRYYRDVTLPLFPES